MLEQLLDYIHNYFVRQKHWGKFSVTDGNLDCDFLQNGQYYKVVGSVFNDGVHQYPSTGLIDEDFCGEVWAMAVPPAVIALSDEIDEWLSKYGEVQNSPYQSESFGGYSYTKASGAGNNGNAEPGATWQSVFRTRLNHWRKIS